LGKATLTGVKRIETKNDGDFDYGLDSLDNDDTLNQAISELHYAMVDDNQPERPLYNFLKNLVGYCAGTITTDPVTKKQTQFKKAEIVGWIRHFCKTYEIVEKLENR